MLLLVPSRLELEKLVPEAEGEGPWTWADRRDRDGRPVLVAAGGVGIALAGARAAALLARTGDRSVLLAGLAGSYDEERARPGSLLLASSVELHGIGVGEGPAHRSLTDCGGALATEASAAQGRLDLDDLPEIEALRVSLLSVASASTDADEARDRALRHPACVAEDMESWSVARAARESGARCSVLRAVSNLAGDRDHGRWRVDDAMATLRTAIDRLTGAAS